MRLLALFVALCCLVLSAAWAESPESAEACIDRANASLCANPTADGIASAIADATTAIGINPRNARAYLVRGMAYARKCEFNRAIADSGTAILLDHSNAEAFMNRASQYIGKANVDRASGHPARYKSSIDKAIIDYTRAVHLNLKDSRARSARAYARYLAGDCALAFADATKARALDPANAQAYMVRGLVYQAKLDWKHALSEYDRVVKLQPDMFNGYSLRFVAHCATKQYENAWADAKKAKALGGAVDERLLKTAARALKGPS